MGHGLFFGGGALVRWYGECSLIFFSTVLVLVSDDCLHFFVYCLLSSYSYLSNLWTFVFFILMWIEAYVFFISLCMVTISSAGALSAKDLTVGWGRCQLEGLLRNGRVVTLGWRMGRSCYCFEYLHRRYCFLVSILSSVVGKEVLCHLFCY